MLLIPFAHKASNDPLDDRSPLPTVDAALAELITEETRLASLVPASLGSMDSVLAAAKSGLVLLLPPFL